MGINELQRIVVFYGTILIRLVRQLVLLRYPGTDVAHPEGCICNGSVSTNLG